MIGENADCQQYPSPYDQSTYLANTELWLGNQSEDENGYYNAVHAYAYFDSTSGEYPIPSQHNTICDWYFDASGQAAFTDISGDANFAPMAPTP